MFENLQKHAVRSADAAVADGVRAFYEQHPYPPRIASLDNYRRQWQDARKRRADYRLFWPRGPFRENHSILVAGCGTSQAAKHAMRWPAARIVGIDFSETSIRCTEELKRKYKLDNLQLHRFPIEQAGQLGCRFKQIVCTGVLHHLADPDAGLAALRHVLEPDGALHLMVYAPYGRAGVYMLQEFCRRIGIRPNEEGITDLAVVLGALPSAHPLRNLLHEAPDFRQPAALADALLHPQDRAYSVPQLFDFLKRGGLSFGRWIKQAPYAARCGALACIPQASRMATLRPVEQYAAAELFRGTMVRHSVVAYRDDHASDPQALSFSGNDWRAYVPIRMPDTIAVQERLPLGAAAVLINRNHTYTDLYLPINALEKQLFDAIDGELSIGEIARKPEHLDTARTLFERLWWYDQVVFDASHAARQ
ncbi:MAG: class I SAM-dependent methyltransferase [Vulcanimicrobiaceae bacterium]